MDLILTPAYGRDYNSKDAVLEAYNEGKDFVLLPDNCYISIRDIRECDIVKFRYSKMRKVFYL